LTKEIKTRLEMAFGAMTKVNAIWKSNISFLVKIKLYKSLILTILVFGCESWTNTADMKCRIQAFENKCYRRILKISYLEHTTNTYVRDKVINDEEQEKFKGLEGKKKMKKICLTSRNGQNAATLN
jgi:hypothetical protein